MVGTAKTTLNTHALFISVFCMQGRECGCMRGNCLQKKNVSRETLSEFCVFCLGDSNKCILCYGGVSLGLVMVTTMGMAARSIVSRETMCSSLFFNACRHGGGVDIVQECACRLVF